MTGRDMPLMGALMDQMVPSTLNPPPPTYPPTWATVLHNKIPVIMGLLPWEAMKSGYVPPANHSGSQQCTHT